MVCQGILNIDLVAPASRNMVWSIVFLNHSRNSHIPILPETKNNKNNSLRLINIEKLNLMLRMALILIVKNKNI